MIVLKNIVVAFKNAFIRALPVILFYLFLFYTVLLFFGLKYVMMVSFITVLFRGKYQKIHTMTKLFTMVAVQLTLCFLSFLATQNLIYCIALNILVPFLLVFFQSSQFQQKGYFASAMGFVFLQLRPTPWSGLPTLMLAMSYALCVSVITLRIFSYINKKRVNYQMARKGLQILANQLDAVCKGTYEEAKGKELFTMQQNMQTVTYQSRSVSYLMDKEGKIYYMFALLFQRSVYFLSSHGKNAEDFSKEQLQSLQVLATFLKESIDFSLTDNTKLIKETNDLLAHMKQSDDMIALYMTNFLNLYQMILAEITTSKTLKPHKDWKMPSYEKLIPSIKRQFRFDSFEFRFAFRLSTVLVIGFVFTRVSGLNHAYWLPLNSFLLLQPMYEDSTTRLKNRFIGTCVGCLLTYVLLPYFPGITGQLFFTSVMVTCMYSFVPGTWQQALFSTSFAITLASISMNETIAIQLRLSYVCIAICLVLLVNRFFFPTSLPGLFRDNIRRMFHLQHAYLQMVYHSMKKPLDYGVVSDGLTKFHLIYNQITAYLDHPKEDIDVEYFKYILTIFWRMASEMEQMLFLINNRKITLENPKILYDYINVCGYVLYQIETLLRIQKETDEIIIDDEQLILHIKDELYASELMSQYSKNLSSLYSKVLVYIHNKHNIM